MNQVKQQGAFCPNCGHAVSTEAPNCPGVWSPTARRDQAEIKGRRPAPVLFSGGSGGPSILSPRLRPGLRLSPGDGSVIDRMASWGPDPVRGSADRFYISGLLRQGLLPITECCMNYPDHLYNVPAYYRRHLGKTPHSELPANTGCKIHIGATYQPAIRITPSVEIHVPREPSAAKQWLWGALLVLGFISFIFLSHIFFDKL